MLMLSISITGHNCGSESSYCGHERWRHGPGYSSRSDEYTNCSDRHQQHALEDTIGCVILTLLVCWIQYVQIEGCEGLNPFQFVYIVISISCQFVGTVDDLLWVSFCLVNPAWPSSPMLYAVSLCVTALELHYTSTISYRSTRVFQ